MVCVTYGFVNNLYPSNGLGLGFAHSLDPDHVVAVSTLLCNNKSIANPSLQQLFGVLAFNGAVIIGLLVLTLSVVIPNLSSDCSIQRWSFADNSRCTCN